MSILEEQLELVKKIQIDNCIKSYKILLRSYDPLIRSLSYSFKSKYKQTPIEIEDIVNVMSFYLYQLTIDYDFTKGKTFPSYIKEFLYYRTSTWIRQYTTLNHQVMNYYETSLENKTKPIDREFLYEELLDPKNTISLSDREVKIINLSKDGYTMKEISKKLDLNLKTLYVIKNKALDKIKINFDIN